MTASFDLAAALAEASRAVDVARSVEETLDLVVKNVVLTLPAFTHAGVTVRHADGRLETMAGTDRLVTDLDELQYDLHEGPCVDALEEESVVLVEHLRHAQRWPRFVPGAVRAGVRSMLGLRLYVEAGTLGALNLYSTTTATVDPDDAQLAELFATHAAIALGRVRTEDQLNRALVTRRVIGQAVGIVTERFRVPEDRAFRFLVRVSQDTNTKLHEVARELVSSTNEEVTREPGD
ncbi:GAF and ANTAR domain-containing protein [Nocardioides solisilvae]|uniref:GAF and ANTAR domain-containing protein n=1 Tax=Nocardioides solisilvae TaxID=1542435 RepID=UPI000D74263E|nr:GAF and ANTAR domain-containing protein [Nocardioides solisilvae]